MSIRFMTINVRGMRDKLKRRQIFNFFRDSNADVILAQETHSQVQDYRFWRSEWGGEVILSHGSIQSAGVAIFVQRHLNFSIISSFTSDDGRLLLAKVSFMSQIFYILNIHAHNSMTDRVIFFTTIHKLLTDKLSGDDSPLIIGGDFNTYLSKFDKSTFSPTLQFQMSDCAKAVISVCESFNLEDIWRATKGDDHGYTRFQASPPVFSRLDLFLTPIELHSNFSAVSIKHATFSDHSALIFQWSVFSASIRRGSPYWKFNSSLLEDDQYISHIRDFINSFSESFPTFSSPHHQWDFLLSALRGETISFASHKNRKIQVRKSELLDEISFLTHALFELPEAYPDYDTSTTLGR